MRKITNRGPGCELRHGESGRRRILIQSTQRIAPPLDNCSVGGGTAKLGPNFVGVDSAGARALTAARDAWAQRSAAHRGGAAAPSAVGPASEAHPQSGSRSAPARAWVWQLQAQLSPAPTGSRLPRIRAHLSTRQVILWGRVPPRLLISPEGDVLAHVGRSAWSLRSPYTDWHLIAEDVGRPCFRPGHREVILPMGRRGLGRFSLSESAATPQPDAFDRFWQSVASRHAESGLGDVACSPDGRTLAATVRSVDGWRVMLVDLETGAAKLLPQVHHHLTDIAWDSDGRQLVVGDCLGRVWRREEGRDQFVKVLETYSRPVKRVVFHPAMPHPWVLWEDGALAEVDLAAGTETGRRHSWSDCVDLVCHPEDDSLVALGATGERRVISGGDLRAHPPEAAPGAPDAVATAVHPSDEWSVTMHEDGTFRVTDSFRHTPWLA